MTNFTKIQEFHDKFSDVPDPTEIDMRTGEVRKLRAELIFEEFKEVLHELGFELYVDTSWNEKEKRVDNKVAFKPRLTGNVMDPRALAKELADLLYVVYGTGAAVGIDMDKVYDEVHCSNMSKLGADGEVIRREDGKVLKGPNYAPPDLSWIPDLYHPLSNQLKFIDKPDPKLREKVMAAWDEIIEEEKNADKDRS